MFYLECLLAISIASYKGKRGGSLQIHPTGEKSVKKAKGEVVRS